MKKSLTALFFLLTMHALLFAEEGLWIPVLLDKLNISQMQDLGLKLTAEDIYSVNNSSLKDAVVQFGGGCTAEIVSADGLILTNHHCGLGTIQRHSTIEHDYLSKEFWAGSREEELANPGLTVTLLVRMEDVTEKVLQGVDDRMSILQRSGIIRKNIESLEKEAVKGTHYQGKIRPFFYGNQYYLFINEVFKDIRLVGAPPSAIGQFGGNTDNWMWPRHGGDFSIFRIYAGKDNKPAAYSKDNVPYRPKNFLAISLKGYEKGDFTFVLGYPGSTREYLTSYGVDLISGKENPARIRLRQKRLDIINEAMDADKTVRIQYTSKRQGIANGWKKMIGETKGVDRLDAVKKKQEFEMEFQKWADSVGSGQLAVGSEYKAQSSVERGLWEENSYINLLPAFENIYSQFLLLDMASIYIFEGGMGIEIVRFAGNFIELARISRNKETKDEELSKALDNLTRAARTFYKDYQAGIDRRVMKEMLPEMKQNMSEDLLPSEFGEIEKKFKGDFAAHADDLFDHSILADSVKLFEFLGSYRKSDYKKLEKDPAYRLALSIYTKNEKDISPLAIKFNSKIDSLQRIYMAGQMEMLRDRRFYPDANSTIRISYGMVNDYSPADGVHYEYYTTGRGVLEKEDPSIYDYAVDPKLKDLLLKKDFGRYADRDGTLHIDFTASNHTTGGNSGSPVLDKNGYLIGINFDRNWEGTMSDLIYDPEQCRNIALDIRYCLFIIDKFAGAENIIKELRIVK